MVSSLARKGGTQTAELTLLKHIGSRRVYLVFCGREMVFAEYRIRSTNSHFRSLFIVGMTWINNAGYMDLGVRAIISVE